jgi:hypothetical protein
MVDMETPFICFDQARPVAGLDVLLSKLHAYVEIPSQNMHLVLSNIFLDSEL